MKMIKKNNKKGFTLVELIIVIAILAILALILVPSITGYIGRANTSRDQANARSFYTAAILATETAETAATEAAITTEAIGIANLPTGVTATITWNTDGTVASVVYDTITFNGTDFGTTTP